MSHTPGPWETDHDYVITGDRTVTILAECRNHADARLMAAAPDLLEALLDAERIIEYVSRGRRYVDVEPYPDAGARAVNARVKDAIAKVRGQVNEVDGQGT